MADEGGGLPTLIGAELAQVVGHRAQPHAPQRAAAGETLSRQIHSDDAVVFGQQRHQMPPALCGPSSTVDEQHKGAFAPLLHMPMMRLAHHETGIRGLRPGAGMRGPVHDQSLRAALTVSESACALARGRET